jgi:hypothetical protein
LSIMAGENEQNEDDNDDDGHWSMIGPMNL